MSAQGDSFSENEDDPAVFESSGSEWDEVTEKKRNKRRTSQRLSKKPRVAMTQSSDSEEDEGERKTKPKNGVNRKQKGSTNTKSSAANKIIPANESASYTPGSFVIAKKDAQSGDMSNPPCIWKIDGKALLQKYEPFKQDDQVRHRNTSIIFFSTQDGLPWIKTCTHL
nr:uncharacterized protein LOC111414878 isoform X2 [Onthophagus taurus]